jgi:hypothetical protein
MKKNLFFTAPILIGLALSSFAQEALVSVNYSRTDDPLQTIDPEDEPFGLIPTNDWLNAESYVGAIEGTSLNLTTNAASGIAPPTGNGWPGEGWPVWYNTVWRGGMITWGPPTPPNFVLDGLATEYPNGYMIVVYTAGWSGRVITSAITDQGASVFVANIVPVADPYEFVETTSSDPANPTEGGNYFVLGSVEAPLTGDSVTVNLGILPSLENPENNDGGKGIGGFQIMTPEVFANGGPIGGDTWAGLEIDAEGWVNTGPWLGFLNVSGGDWVWAESWAVYIYMPEAFVSEGGAWLFYPNAFPEVFANANPGADGTWAGLAIDAEGWVNTNPWLGFLNVSGGEWVWAESWAAYVYMPEAFVSEGGVWLYFPN